MEKYLPEWFDENEFENFLTEGPYTRQAWIKGIKRWRRTKFMLRSMLGKTPMKYISRAMRSKHAIMARTAMQNARDIQAAQDREEKLDAARNFVKQEALDLAFNNFLSEKLNSGSDRAVNFGTRPSAGERATMKNPTGDPKVQAKLKKRIQRQDEKRYSTEAVELEEAKTVKMKRTRRARNTKEKSRTPDQMRGTKTPQQKQQEKAKSGTKAKKTQKSEEDDKSPTELAKKGNVSKVIVVRGKDNKVRIVSKDSYDPNYHTQLYPQSKNKTPSRTELESYLSNKDFAATEMSNLIFPKDERAKPKRRLTDEEKNKKETRTKVDKRSQEVGPTNQFEIVPPNPEDMMRRGAPLKALEAQDSSMISGLVLDPRLAKLLGDKKFLTPQQIAKYNEIVRNNPSIVRIGDDTRQELFALASRENQNLSGKNLIAISSMNKQGCGKASQEHMAAGSSDATPKADIFVVAEDNLIELIDYLNGKNCGDTKKLSENVVGFSYKKGFDAPIASSQPSETLATLLTVQDMIRQVSNGELPPEISTIFNQLISEVRNVQQLAHSMGGSEFGGTIAVNDPSYTVNIMKKLTDKEIEARGWGNANQFRTQSEPIKQKIEGYLEELMENQLFKKALIYAQISGERKFAQDSLGRVNGIMMASSDGSPVHGMMLPGSFEEVLKNPVYSEEFDEMVSVMRVDVRAKSRPIYRTVEGQKVKTGVETTPISTRTERMPRKSLQLQNFQVDNELDQLFEYTFLPPDFTSTTMVQDMGASDAARTMKPLDAQLMGFNSYSSSQQNYDEELNPNTILGILNMSGLIENITIDPIDFEELGLKLRYRGSPIINKVSVNGVNFEIPVINNKMDEFFQNYELLNDILVEQVKNGMRVNEAREIMGYEIPKIIMEKRNYKREYKLFHGKPEQRAKRSKRVLARRKMAKKLGRRAISGKDIDHKNGNALDNSDKNLRVRSINKNRADNGHSKKRIAETWGAGLEGSAELTLKWLRETPGQLGLIDPKLLQLLLKNKGQSR